MAGVGAGEGGQKSLLESLSLLPLSYSLHIRTGKKSYMKTFFSVPVQTFIGAPIRWNFHESEDCIYKTRSNRPL